MRVNLLFDGVPHEGQAPTAPGLGICVAAVLGRLAIATVVP
jgi:hypothetical protein